MSSSEKRSAGRRGKRRAPPSAETQPPHAGGSGARPDAAHTGRLSVEVYSGLDGAPRCVSMTGDSLIIGREEGDLRIEDLLVSRRHAAIEQGDQGAPILRDLDSTNGTFLNGALLLAPAALHDGDDIRIGPSHIRVRIGDD